MSFKNLVGMFVETEDDHQPTQQPQSAQSSIPVSYTTTNISTPYDQDMVGTLQKVILGRKTAYTALVEASDRLRNFIPDDNTRFKAASIKSYIQFIRQKANMPNNKPLIESDKIDLVTISRDEYDQLIKDQKFLEALRAAGVDNWDGWDYTCEQLEEALRAAGVDNLNNYKQAYLQLFRQL